MKSISKIFLTVTLLFLVSEKSDAQFFFRAGYNVGFTNPKEVNRVIYIHNQINSIYYASGKEMSKVNNFGGIQIAMGSEFEKNSGWEMSWTNKHHVSKSEFQYQAQTVNRYLKVRTNNFGLGFYGGSDHIAFGGSLDFGNFKGFYKRTDDTSKNAKYVSVFQNQLVFGGSSDQADHSILRTLQMGFTPFIQLKSGPIGLRIFYQLQFMNMPLDNIDNRLVGADIETDNQLEDKMSNFGLMLFIQLGGSK
ncbi:MAG: hypothetical protein WCI97_01635 [Bacteroidota bacterium]